MEGKKSFLEAVRTALDEEMERDAQVYLFGEDVAVGGPFGATRGLAEKYGGSRVRNTPISEAAISGMGVGAALCGMRPVMEIMFMDFITLGMDALVNQAAKYCYMSNGQLAVPIVIRTQAGAAGGAAAQHSQSFEAWLCHVPGLTVVAPSSPIEAYGLLKSAIRLNDPVVFVEHKRLYSSRESFTNSDSDIPIGRARVVRSGTDATILTYSYMLQPVMDVVEKYEERGKSIEVIDLRTLVPLDMATILDSIRRTHRVAIAHEAVQSSGLGAEIAARIADEGFDELDGPIVRIGCPFAPIPFSPTLEDSLLPGFHEIDAALNRLVM